MAWERFRRGETPGAVPPQVSAADTSRAGRGDWLGPSRQTPEKLERYPSPRPHATNAAWRAVIAPIAIHEARSP
jgi:hypothetical protein